jgi:K+-sensing histidine kinase KdpD
MNTFFAPAERLDDEAVKNQIEFASKNPIIDSVLNAGNGVLAILNTHRQIVAVNKSLLSFLNIDTPESIFGLRPGEAVECIHAHELEGGCGTSSWCSTCGAAIAIVSAMADKKPVTKKCIISTSKQGIQTELCFLVRSSIITFQENDFILLFLQDISINEQRNAFERMFNHDIKNLLTGICCSVELLEINMNAAIEGNVKIIQKLIARLKCELLVHGSISETSNSEYVLNIESFQLSTILDELKTLMEGHTVSIGKHLNILDKANNSTLKTDYSLLFRVLMNLLINAFEASKPGDEVKLICEKTDQEFVFNILNNAFIKPEIERRVFQQFFSTKDGDGRGFGTYGTKCICEKFLNGSVDFTTSEKVGTKFRVKIPLILD